MPGGVKVLGKKLETLKEGDAKKSDVNKWSSLQDLSLLMCFDVTVGGHLLDRQW